RCTTTCATTWTSTPAWCWRALRLRRWGGRSSRKSWRWRAARRPGARSTASARRSSPRGASGRHFERRRGVPHQAYKFTAEVGEGGKVELTLPLPQGSRVEGVVLTDPEDEFADLRDAAASSMGFWDNPLDDAEWNKT